MFIKAIKWDGEMTVQYCQKAEEFTLTSKETPAKEFFDALKDLKDVFCKSLQLPADRLAVNGIKIKDSNDGVQYIPTGYLYVTNTNNEINIAGVPMTTKSEKWYLQNCPDKHPEALVPNDRIKILKFILAALHFIEGERDQRELEFEEKPETKDSLELRTLIAVAEKEAKEFEAVEQYWLNKEINADEPLPGEQKENLFDNEDDVEVIDF